MSSPETEFRYAPYDVVGAYSILGQRSQSEDVELYEAVDDRSLDSIMLKIGKTPESDEVLRHEAAMHSRFTTHANVVPISGHGEHDSHLFVATLLQPEGTLVEQITESRKAVTTTSPLETALHELADELKDLDTSRDSPVLDAPYVQTVKEILHKGPATEKIHVLEERKVVHASDIMEVAIEAASQAGLDAEADSLEVKKAVYDWANELSKTESEIDSSSLPDRETVLRRASILAGVARAVGVMHGVGVVHRDIKPGNTAVTMDNRGAVLDFGIATRDFSKRNLVHGTVGFMPLEAMEGIVSPAGDNFALAATAYETLTSIRPWEGISDKTADAYSRIKSEVPVHPSDLNPNITRFLGDTIMRGLSDKPYTRPTASHFEHAFMHAHVGVNSTI